MYEEFFKGRPAKLAAVLDLLEEEIWTQEELTIPSRSIVGATNDYYVLTTLLLDELKYHMADRNLRRAVKYQQDKDTGLA